MYKCLSLALCLMTIGTVRAEIFSFQVSTPVYTTTAMKKMLGPYPEAGSEEHFMDFDTLLDIQDQRTPESCAVAAKQKSFTLTNLFVVDGGPLTRQEALILSPLMAKVYLDAEINIQIAKNAFKRRRPYLTNFQIVPCVGLEKSYAYPSGHATLSRLAARVLAKLFPERAEAFIRRADAVAWNRVLGGVHHPSDIVAGKKLGDMLANGFRRK
ncbi:MAG TPA: phosphatase PAP2 family protein [Bacteriovoracaceae bacterium]|nr:phosphatase PAP2 family protein [Bacteriovoracaceae bacterium]